MRIDELDPKHKEFKSIILDHELTEQQLNELVPLAALAGTAARVAGGAIAKGATRVAGMAGGAMSRGAGALSNIGKNAISRVGKAIGNAGTDLATQQRGTATKRNIGINKTSLKTNTAQKLSQQGNGKTTIGSQGTTGTQGTQQTKLQRGQEFSVPMTDPNSPNKTAQTKMKVKNVTGSEVELAPSKKVKGLPKTIKYNKKDIALS